jgi:tRNA(His) 5'-end guanylyltransferase
MHDLMVATTKSLVEETNAKVGYTQSDEITLVWYESNPQTQVWFDGKIHKMVSQLGSLATLYFNTYLGDYLPLHYALKGPTFDARVWNVPTVDEAFNCLVSFLNYGFTAELVPNSKKLVFDVVYIFPLTSSF